LALRLTTRSRRLKARRQAAGAILKDVLRRWRYLLSALLAAVLSGTPAVAAVCLGWCDEVATTARHHAPAEVPTPDDDAEDGAGHDHHSGHTAAPASVPSPPPAIPCHGSGASDDAALGALIVAACDDALTAAETLALGASRLHAFVLAPATGAAVAVQAPLSVDTHRAVRPSTHSARFAGRAVLVLRL
jgi:hypothetical protein